MVGLFTVSLTASNALASPLKLLPRQWQKSRARRFLLRAVAAPLAGGAV